jgi:hypothetical protein
MGSDRGVCKWIRSIQSEGVDPSTVVLEGFDYDDPDALDDGEKDWIAKCKALGCDLTNMNNGGKGNRGFSPGLEARAKMRKAKLGKTHTDEAKERMSAAQLRNIEEKPYLTNNRLEALRKEREENPDRQSEFMVQWWKDHPEHAVKIADYWQTHPDAIIAKTEKVRKAWESLDRTPLMCECGAGPFVGEWGIDRHMSQKHGNDKYDIPQMCECGDGPFAGDHGLNVHRGYCGKTDPTMCIECGDGPFVGPAGLSAHRSHKHVEGRKDPVMCECGAGPFKGQHGLSGHTRQAHADAIDTWCECGAGPFNGTTGLSTHQRYCGSQPEEVCQECGAGPFVRGGLNSHTYRSHTPEGTMPLTCECGAGPFKGSIGLAGHKRQACPLDQ